MKAIPAKNNLDCIKVEYLSPVLYPDRKSAHGCPGISEKRDDIIYHFRLDKRLVPLDINNYIIIHRLGNLCYPVGA
jgi:hypothetical protein